eukprot:jgi/Picsp_1/3722/NSC_06558-R1_dna-binding protein rhl1
MGDEDVLQKKAWRDGLLSSSRWIASAQASIPKQLRQANEKDIIKKGSGRKGRYLCVFGDRLQSMAGGKIGMLAKLDSKNPVMYVDFREGRLKFQGTLLFPKNKYISLRVGNKDVICEDIFECVIVFSDANWVGSKEENPTEKPLPLPQSLLDRRIHETKEQVGELDVGPKKRKAKVDEEPTDVATEGGSQRPQRSARAKQVKYNDGNDGNDVIDLGADSDSE